MVVDPGPVAGCGRHDRRVQLRRPDRRRRDRDRALHPGVLADRRVPVGRGDARRHRPMIRAGTIGRVPTWTPDPARFPRFALLDGPSPLAPLARLSAVLGGRAELWIKREDLLPLAFGGNKLRNLEYLVGAALAEGADTLVTSGRRWSNHARLTAAAGARAGLEVHLVLSGPPADPPNPGVVLDELLGATVHHAVTDDRAERAALVERCGGSALGRPAAVRRRGRRIGCRRRGRTGRWPASSWPTARRCAGSCPTTSSSRRRPAGPSRAWSWVCERPVPNRGPRDRGHAARGAPCQGRGDGRRSRRSSMGWIGSGRSPATRSDLDDDQLGAGYGTTDRCRRGCRPPPRPDRGHPGRPDLHREGAGRAHRARPVGRARRPSGRVLARRWHARPVRTAGRRRRLTRSGYSPDRHASRSLIRPPNWRTAPA